MPRANAHEQNDMHAYLPNGIVMRVAAEQVIGKEHTCLGSTTVSIQEHCAEW